MQREALSEPGAVATGLSKGLIVTFIAFTLHRGPGRYRSRF